MSDTKQREKERLGPKAISDMREWLTTMPLSIQNPERNLRYIADFIAVAAHLKLPQNSRILEIGAGSCWPSEWLYRMGYRTVSTDISADMLRLGRERFLPLRRERDNFALFSHFVCADAEELPFVDGSFDAVIVFNAFHHVPDLARSLAEIFRVLSDNGRFVLAEPGEGHSQTDEAKREMSEHGVQEEDVLIDEVALLAAGAGFAETEIILNLFPDISIPFDAWRRFSRSHRGWRYKARLVADVVRRQRTHPCLVLKKGTGGLLDSRRPGMLRAALAVVEAPDAVQAGHPFRIKVQARNLGDTRWISQGTFLEDGAMNLGEGGYVALGAKLRAEDGVTVDDNFGRGPLRTDVAPTDQVLVEALLRAPERAGRYRLKLDLVDEGIAWFEDCGSETLEVVLTVVSQNTEPVFDSRFPDLLLADMRLSPSRLLASPGDVVKVGVASVNAGNTLWRARAPEDDPPAFGGGYVRLGWQLRDGEGALLDLNYGRIRLPADVPPGESLELTAEVTVPEKPGVYLVVFDFVDEKIAWFGDRGSQTATLTLEVRSEVAPSPPERGN